jgi:hypothetical protein
MLLNKLCSYLKLHDRDDIPNRGERISENYKFITEEGPEKVTKFLDSIKEDLIKIFFYKK